MLGKRIEEERLRKKMNQEDLAKLLNVQKEMVDRYEKDKAAIPFTTLLSLSKTFKRPLGYFFQDVIVKK